MERSVAIKKLTSLLGKGFGYRVDLKAPDEEERAEAREKLKIARGEREELTKLKDSRMRELLVNDAEFQRLKALEKEARISCEKLQAITNRYRFTVGHSMSIFFSVDAQGDSWEEVIAKVKAKKKQPA